ncbi:MAG: hypothetical protein VYA69_00715 [Gemmatimonadota bacterium]|nr:hypothetical protein [Gemmatimonadota bacterium]
MKSLRPEHSDTSWDDRRSALCRDDDRERHDRYQQAIERSENLAKLAEITAFDEVCSLHSSTY